MKKVLNKKLTLLSLVGVIVSTSLAPINVLAVTDSFFSANDILFYSRDSVCVTSTNTSGLSSPVTVNKSPELERIFQLLVDGEMNAGQAAAVMGNMYTETGGSFSGDQHEAGNDIGYGLAQWSFGRRTNLEAFAEQKGVPPSDIPMQIEFLINEYSSSYKARLDDTPFKDGSDIAASTTAWMRIFEAPMEEPLNDPAKLNSERIPAANIIYGYYGGLAHGSATAVAGCNPSENGVVAGDIVNTALGLALTSPATNGMTSKADARDTYQTAKEQYNPASDWTDCGGFVSTVLKSSGVDPNYPMGTSIQATYVRSHPEKYVVIEDPSLDGTDLQPGDILISTDVGHTILYTGQQAYPYADASLGERVPSVRPSTGGIWMLENGAIIARVIK